MQLGAVAMYFPRDLLTFGPARILVHFRNTVLGAFLTTRLCASTRLHRLSILQVRVQSQEPINVHRRLSDKEQIVGWCVRPQAYFRLAAKLQNPAMTIQISTDSD